MALLVSFFLLAVVTDEGSPSATCSGLGAGPWWLAAGATFLLVAGPVRWSPFGLLGLLGPYIAVVAVVLSASWDDLPFATLFADPTPTQPALAGQCSLALSKVAMLVVFAVASGCILGV